MEELTRFWYKFAKELSCIQVEIKASSVYRLDRCSDELEACEIEKKIEAVTKYQVDVRDRFIEGRQDDVSPTPLDYRSLFQHVAVGWFRCGFFAAKRQAADEGFLCWGLQPEGVCVETKWTPQSPDTEYRFSYIRNFSSLKSKDVLGAQANMVKLKDSQVAWFPLDSNRNGSVGSILDLASSSEAFMRPTSDALMDSPGFKIGKIELRLRSLLSEEEQEQADRLADLLRQFGQAYSLTAACLVIAVISAINRELVTFYCPEKTTKLEVDWHKLKFNPDGFTADQVDALIHQSILKHHGFI